jgi:phosphoribosyl 1,2-cyclic phosphodiesterase
VATSHDAREPVGFVFSTSTGRIGWVTDTGVFTPLLEQRLRDCDGLFLEANHDADLLRHGPYPWPLKQRIASRLGHLGNHQTAEALDRIGPRSLKVLVALHLSAHNNRADIVQETLAPLLPPSTPVHAVTRGEMLRLVISGDDVNLNSQPVPAAAGRKKT